VLALLTFVSTVLGGLFALRHRDRMHRIPNPGFMITPTFGPRVAGSRHVAYRWMVAWAIEWV
jgi:hypothetical protein